MLNAAVRTKQTYFQFYPVEKQEDESIVGSLSGYNSVNPIPSLQDGCVSSFVPAGKAR